MRIVLCAVGRLKDAECTLFDRYWQRIEAGGRGVGLSPVRAIELPESREATAVQRQAAEARRLLSAAEAEADTTIVALDERGKAMTSAAFTDMIRRQRDDGCREMAFLLGGPDGHGPVVAQAARITLSLGPMTLPHGLARVVLAEQLYRCVTILAGHPYHRV